MEATVRKSIMVNASQERAFTAFTRDIGSWWPSSHHLLRVAIVEMVFEPREGGHVYERGEDGSECRWARVLTWNPPQRVVISWDIDPRWQLETDPARASEVEVRFIAESATRTRVELEHRGLERHGPGWESMQDAVAGTQGWPMLLGRFADSLIPAQRVTA